MSLTALIADELRALSVPQQMGPEQVATRLGLPLDAALTRWWGLAPLEARELSRWCHLLMVEVDGVLALARLRA